MDFTYNKYKQILETVSSSDYSVYNIKDYINLTDKNKKVILIRHDVDLNPYEQTKFAQLEKIFGISTSYYFRYVDNVFNEKIIDEISSLGHEIGYHYEVITKSRGDSGEAINLFKEELSIFQNNWNSVTVCPHGGSYIEGVDGYNLNSLLKLVPKILAKETIFSKWVNFDIWDKNKLEEFNLIGDAYYSIDFKPILYLSDTGRSWNNKYKRLDKVDSEINKNINIKNSDDIIKILKEGKVDNIYLLIHFEQWKDNFIDWLFWYISQVIRRNGKKIIFGK